MSAISNNQGRAYEYAWIKALYNALHTIRETRIVNNSSLNANSKAWSAISSDMQTLFKISANSAVNTILELEPRMIENAGDELILEFQEDSVGTKGDVRDVVVRRGDIEWEIGLSIKHNHEAVKHSRLSHGLDFGKEWFGIPCSSTYWDAVNPIFERLISEKSNGTNWSDLENKRGTVYIPLLNAFIDEVHKAAKSSDTSMPQKMVEYLIGTNDYYKVVSHDGKQLTVIHTFNTHGTLNKPSKIKVSAISVPNVELPTELVALKFKKGSSNTVEMYLNNGWQLSFRIHNARTMVEPSLKFDVQLIGTPNSILHIECKWN